MAGKALLQVDLQIALLRDQSDFAQPDVTTWELSELLKKREELIPKMLVERFGDFQLAA
jgi:hypothetical protein